MILGTFIKQPAEVKDYDVDFSPWLNASGDTIDDVTVTAACVNDPSDTTLAIDSTANTTTVLKVWVSGGTSGNKYKVTIRVTTPTGRLDESELIFKVKDY